MNPRICLLVNEGCLSAREDELFPPASRLWMCSAHRQTSPRGSWSTTTAQIQPSPRVKVSETTTGEDLWMQGLYIFILDKRRWLKKTKQIKMASKHTTKDVNYWFRFHLRDGLIYAGCAAHMKKKTERKKDRERKKDGKIVWSDEHRLTTSRDSLPFECERETAKRWFAVLQASGCARQIKQSQDGGRFRRGVVAVRTQPGSSIHQPTVKGNLHLFSPSGATDTSGAPRPASPPRANSSRASARLLSFPSPLQDRLLSWASLGAYTPHDGCRHQNVRDRERESRVEHWVHPQTSWCDGCATRVKDLTEVREPFSVKINLSRPW